MRLLTMSFMVATLSLAIVSAIWAAKEEPLKPGEVQLITHKVYAIRIEPPGKFDGSYKLIDNVVWVNHFWRHDGFVFTAEDNRLSQHEPMISPTSIEILPRIGQNYTVRATMLPYQWLTSRKSGWRMKTADGKVRLLEEGNLRLTVRGEKVKVEVFGPQKTDRFWVRSEMLLLWSNHQSPYHF